MTGSAALRSKGSHLKFISVSWSQWFIVAVAGNRKRSFWRDFNMDCSDARHLIHLDVGDDLRADEELQLAEHMGQCGECRAYHAGMSCAMNALVVVRDASSADAERPADFRSVWPNVSREIQRRRPVPAQVSRFNLQIAALSVCSLSLAVVTIVQSLSAMRSSVDQGEFMPAQSVSHPASMPQFEYDARPLHSGKPDQLLPGLLPTGTSRPQSF